MQFSIVSQQQQQLYSKSRKKNILLQLRCPSNVHFTHNKSQIIFHFSTICAYVKIFIFAFFFCAIENIHIDIKTNRLWISMQNAQIETKKKLLIETENYRKISETYRSFIFQMCIHCRWRLHLHFFILIHRKWVFLMYDEI